MMDWILNLIPWWAYAIAAVIAIVTVWRLFGWQGALLSGAGLLAILGYGKGRNDAFRDEEARRRKEQLDHVVIRNRVEDDIADLGAQDVDDKLARWNRD